MHSGIQICGSVPEQDLEGRDGFRQSDLNASPYLQEPMPGLGLAEPLRKAGAIFHAQELGLLLQSLVTVGTYWDHK